MQALGKPSARHLRERGSLRGVGEREIEYVAADALRKAEAIFRIAGDIAANARRDFADKKERRPHPDAGPQADHDGLMDHPGCGGGVVHPHRHRIEAL